MKKKKVVEGNFNRYYFCEQCGSFVSMYEWTNDLCYKCGNTNISKKILKPFVLRESVFFFFEKETIVYYSDRKGNMYAPSGKFLLRNEHFDLTQLPDCDTLSLAR